MGGKRETAGKERQTQQQRIVAFCCENSALQACEAAAEDGFAELVDIVGLPCSGKAEIGLVLQVLERGRPGVLILGCPRDNCKFLRGNLRAEKRTQRIRQILRETGYGEERVRMDFLSSVDSHRFGEMVRAMAEDLRQLDKKPALAQAAAAGGGAAHAAAAQGGPA